MCTESSSIAFWIKDCNDGRIETKDRGKICQSLQKKDRASRHLKSH